MIGSEEAARFLEQAADIANKQKPVQIPDLVAPDFVPCAMCGRKLHLSEIRHYNTGVVNASDALCPECSRNFPKHSCIVCVRCCAIVARIPPMRMKSGFVIKPNTFYHTQACPNCKPGVRTTDIIEAKLFYERK